jgi:hypothetical protein
MKWFVSAYKGLDENFELAKRKKILAKFLISGYSVKEINNFYFIIVGDAVNTVTFDFDVFISQPFSDDFDDIHLIKEFIDVNDIEIHEWDVEHLPAHYRSLVLTSKSDVKKLEKYLQTEKKSV